MGRADVDKAISTTPEQLLGTLPKEDKPPGDVPMDTTEATSAVVSKKRSESESSGDGAETASPIKKAKLDASRKFKYSISN